MRRRTCGLVTSAVFVSCSLTSDVVAQSSDQSQPPAFEIEEEVIGPFAGDFYYTAPTAINNRGDVVATRVAASQIPMADSQF